MQAESVRPTVRPSFLPSDLSVTCRPFRPLRQKRPFTFPSFPTVRPSVLPFTICPSVLRSFRPSFRPSVLPPFRPSFHTSLSSTARHVHAQRERQEYRHAHARLSVVVFPRTCTQRTSLPFLLRLSVAPSFRSLRFTSSSLGRVVLPFLCMLDRRVRRGLTGLDLMGLWCGSCGLLLATCSGSVRTTSRVVPWTTWTGRDVVRVARRAPARFGAQKRGTAFEFRAEAHLRCEDAGGV